MMALYVGFLKYRLRLCIIRAFIMPLLGSINWFRRWEHVLRFLSFIQRLAFHCLSQISCYAGWSSNFQTGHFQNPAWHRSGTTLYTTAVLVASSPSSGSSSASFPYPIKEFSCYCCCTVVAFPYFLLILRYLLSAISHRGRSAPGWFEIT